MGKGSSPKTAAPALTEEARNLWKNTARPSVMGVFNKPYQPYTGNRVAGLNGMHQSAFGLAGSPSAMPMDAASARGYLNRTIADNGLGTPVPQNPYIGKSVGANPMLGTRTGVLSNPMLEANNPYFESTLKNALNDVTDQFQRNRIAQTDANMARHNLFGGSNWADAQRLNQRELASTLGNVSTNARLQEYNNRAQLHEAHIGRRLQAEQSDIARNAGLYEAGLGRTQTEQARDAELAQMQIGMANQNANLHRAQQMQAASLLPNIAQAETADTAKRYDLLANAAGLQKQQEQSVLDSAYQDFTDQRDYDKQQSEYLRQWLATLNGGPQAAGAEKSPSLSGKILGSGLTGLGVYSALAATPFGIPAGIAAAGLSLMD